MPAGQASTRRFTVTGFILPVSMAYSGDSAVRSRVPGIASSKDAAVGFVSRLVMQTVIDVLEQQGRSVLLPDAVISAILDQLSVQISYEPLECKAAALDAAVAMDSTMIKCYAFGLAERKKRYLFPRVYDEEGKRVSQSNYNYNYNCNCNNPDHNSHSDLLSIMLVITKVIMIVTL
ncbi:hypothetical protein KIN20_005373 [Parelaphostrongylus tenuis]|uniref:Uncharacterized protein n=1 Tax=Parelaphostrongylus tenuis TaxID=148309 RepID=A0AAD5QHF0_PARTN|nr:hypothetical protein KIN20_005373 [Parelaphostrongylus tenuis]